MVWDPDQSDTFSRHLRPKLNIKWNIQYRKFKIMVLKLMYNNIWRVEILNGNLWAYNYLCVFTSISILVIS